MGYVLSILHDVAKVLSRAITPSVNAYDQMQAHFDRLKAEARSKHGRTAEIEAERQRVLHNALRGVR